MAIDVLPNREEWLRAELDRMKLSQNEAARLANISAGTLSKFADGDVGARSAVRIANFFNAPTQLVLAMVGLAPPPPTMVSAEAEQLGHIYNGLDEEKRRMLMSYALHLSSQR